MFFVPLIEKYLSNAIHKFEFCTPKLSIGIQIADYSDYNLFRIICDESSSGVCNGSSLSFFFFFFFSWPNTATGRKDEKHLYLLTVTMSELKSSPFLRKH